MVARARVRTGLVEEKGNEVIVPPQRVTKQHEARPRRIRMGGGGPGVGERGDRTRALAKELDCLVSGEQRRLTLYLPRLELLARLEAVFIGLCDEPSCPQQPDVAAL